MQPNLRFAIAAFVLAIGLCASDGSAQQAYQEPQQGMELKEPVSRHEFESLRSGYEQLQSQLTDLATVNKGLGELDEDQINSPLDIKSTETIQRDCDCRLPGWKKIRSSDWMSLGRRQRMTVRIGRAGDMDLYLGLNTVGRLQYLRQSNVVDSIGLNTVVNGPLEPGIQTPFGQFSFLAEIDRGAIEAYADIFIASRPHEDELQANEGYILFRSLSNRSGLFDPTATFFDWASIKLGAFEIDFGDAHYRRSNNGDTIRNPLIGNYVVDPRTTELGFEIFGKPAQRPVNWLLGVGVGNTGDFQANRGIQVHGKLFGDSVSRVRPAVSFYRADHSRNPTGFPNSGSKSDLFRSNRAGGPYADVLGAGNAPGQVLPGNGQNVTAIQFDLTLPIRCNELYGHFGMVEDSDLNGSGPGSPTESWLYYAAEGIHWITPRYYFAARYSGASAGHLESSLDPTSDIRSDGHVNRFQAGSGYWIHDTILAKLEIVHQSYNGFSADGSQVSGVDVWEDPRFYGVLMEVSFSF